MTPVVISFDTFTNTGELELAVDLDHGRVWQGRIGADTYTVKIELDDQQEAQHLLCLQLDGKTADDTKLDHEGNIVSDKLLFIQHMCFDDIQLGQTFLDVTSYQHDGNGTREPVKDRFFGTMGCNGTVSMSFSTPVYRWLLENM